MRLSEIRKDRDDTVPCFRCGNPLEAGDECFAPHPRFDGECGGWDKRNSHHPIGSLAGCQKCGTPVRPGEDCTGPHKTWPDEKCGWKDSRTPNSEKRNQWDDYADLVHKSREDDWI